MRHKGQPMKRAEYVTENNTILRYFKKELQKEHKDLYPTKTDEEIADIMIQKHIPVYKPYNYSIDITAEFAKENDQNKEYMLNYLVTECLGCTSNPCLNRHPNQNIRRKPQRLYHGMWNYIPKACISKNCPQECEFSHCPEEINYHPMLYKTKPCQHPIVNGKCKQLGHLCYYAHDDLRVPSLSFISTEPKSKPEEPKKDEGVFALDTFKTVQCKIVGLHDKMLCNYWHDHRDRRRDPTKFLYSCKQCVAGFNREYKCKYKDLCKSCHNEIEELYHRDNYQTKVCRSENCKMGEKCPFTHQAEPAPKENLQVSIKKYADANEALNTELTDIQEKMQDMLQFQCSFCNTEGSESILNCGHLTCGKCQHGDSCDICFLPIHPSINIKLI